MVNGSRNSLESEASVGCPPLHMDPYPLGSTSHWDPWKNQTPGLLDYCWEKCYIWWGNLFVSASLWLTENSWFRHLWSVTLRRKLSDRLFYVTFLWQKRLLHVFTLGGNLIQGTFLSVPSGLKIITYFWILTRREVRQVRPLALKPPLELESYELILGDCCRGCCFVPSGS